uniref:Uncharacterized protein n=1 Tax=Glossina palpalis gambiensis TaxID=67801 RepID=A0A1B0BTG1_9MUSC
MELLQFCLYTCNIEKRRREIIWHFYSESPWVTPDCVVTFRFISPIPNSLSLPMYIGVLEIKKACKIFKIDGRPSFTVAIPPVEGSKSLQTKKLNSTNCRNLNIRPNSASRQLSQLESTNYYHLSLDERHSILRTGFNSLFLDSLPLHRSLPDLRHSTDDFNDTAFDIENYVANPLMRKAKFLPLKNRYGMNKALSEGQVKVLVFLDAHIKANEDWLPPSL